MDWAKVSEMCVFLVKPSVQPEYRMLFECCDGTAFGERGCWTIGSALSKLK